MASSKIRQYRCLLKFSVCHDNEPLEGDKQEKIDMELNYKIYTIFFIIIY